MNKKYYFLSGLHRSGNTLLSAILNQNKDMYVSPLSPVNEYMWQCLVGLNNSENGILNLNKNRSENVIKNIIHNYYYDVEKPIIFDRSKTWLNPDNLEMIKNFIDPDPKIIFTVRPIRECVASLIKIDKENILDYMELDDFIMDEKISENDNIVNYMISYHSIFSLNNFAYQMYNLYKDKNFIHIVKYEDLVDNTKETIDKIYDFLQLKKYEHNFTDIKTPDFYDYDKLRFSKDMHHVRKNITKSLIDPKKFISQNSIEKCNEYDFFYF